MKRFWMVVRKNSHAMPADPKTGQPRTLRARKRHFSKELAMAEATRLATHDPGAIFVVVEAVFAVSILDGNTNDAKVTVYDPIAKPAAEVTP